MKISLIITTLLFACASHSHAAITEKINTHAARIAQLKKDIKTNKPLNISSKCDARGECSVKA